MIVAAFFSSFSGAKYVCDPESKLPVITYWYWELKQGFAQDLVNRSALILVSSAGLILVSGNWMSGNGDDEARQWV